VPTMDHVVYVSRGTHVVTGTADGVPLRKEERVLAGDVVSVVLEASGSAGASLQSTRASLPSETSPPAGEERPRRSGWSPWVFVGGATLTSIAVGFTVASGVDTDNARDTWLKDKTATNLSSGQAKQLRTNVLLGTSIALGAATAAVGIWLIDWHPGSQRVEVGIASPFREAGAMSGRRLEPPGVRLRWCF
jgi:hypothetical protein